MSAAKRHYLAIYDAAMSVTPTGQVRAFVHQKRPLQVDMVWLVPNYELSMFEQMSKALKETIHEAHVSWKGRLVDVQFSNRVELSLTIGRCGLCIDDINKIEHNDDRILLRESAGSSEEYFIQFLQERVQWAGDHLLKRFTDSNLPLLYWTVHSYHYVDAFSNVDRFDIISGVAEHCHQFKTEPLINPFCVEEDLNTLAAAKLFFADD